MAQRLVVYDRLGEANRRGHEASFVSREPIASARADGEMKPDGGPAN
jgi:hypothetical protein